MKLSIAHPAFTAHHRYQLEVILLFVFGFFLLFPYYLAIEEYGLNQNVWQWFIFWPWMFLFVTYSLYTRNKIPPRERTNPLKRPIGHWVLLGISIVALNLQAPNLQALQSLDLMFIIFSLFMADSYWDFRNIRNTNNTKVRN